MTKTKTEAHTIETIRSPLRVYLRCSCGWSHMETRRQNALARASKLEAAARGHRARVAALVRTT